MGKKDDKKFYFFKVDRDKIKLHLKDIGSKFIPRKNRRKGAALLLSFILLLAVGLTIYFNQDQETDNKMYITDIKNDTEEGSSDSAEDIFTDEFIYNNREELQLTSKELQYRDKSEQKEGTEDKVKTDDREVEGVVTESLRPVVNSDNSDSLDLLKPVSGPVLYDRGWYMHPIFDDWRYLSGIKLKGNTGDIVMAADSGKVISVREDEYKGVVVEIDHGDNWKTIYGHLDKASVTIDEVVGKGQEVGRVGSTGITGQPVLYFELRNQKGTIDPTQFF